MMLMIDVTHVDWLKPIPEWGEPTKTKPKGSHRHHGTTHCKECRTNNVSVREAKTPAGTVHTAEETH